MIHRPPVDRGAVGDPVADVCPGSYAPGPDDRAAHARDRFCCAYCGSKADTVDHVIRAARWRPLVENASRAARPATTAGRQAAVDLGWALRRAPVPRRAALATAVQRQGTGSGVGRYSVRARPDRWPGILCPGAQRSPVDTVFVVSTMEIHLFLSESVVAGGRAVGVDLVRRAPPRDLQVVEPWTHPPILWLPDEAVAARTGRRPRRMESH